MASSEYRSGDELRVDVELCNPGAALSAIPLFSFFDVYGELYFWPSWTHYSANTSAGQADWQIQPAVPTGASYVNILSAELPEMTESIPGVVWYGGMTNPSITEVLGDVGSHEFSLVP